jgi:hypothetical protein
MPATATSARVSGKDKPPWVGTLIIPCTRGGEGQDHHCGVPVVLCRLTQECQLAGSGGITTWERHRMLLMRRSSKRYSAQLCRCLSTYGPPGVVLVRRLHQLWNVICIDLLRLCRDRELPLTSDRRTLSTLAPPDVHCRGRCAKSYAGNLCCDMSLTCHAAAFCR